MTFTLGLVLGSSSVRGRGERLSEFQWEKAEILSGKVWKAKGRRNNGRESGVRTQELDATEGWGLKLLDNRDPPVYAIIMMIITRKTHSYYG